MTNDIIIIVIIITALSFLKSDCHCSLNASSQVILALFGLMMRPLCNNTRCTGAELAGALSTRSKSGISGAYSLLAYRQQPMILVVTTLMWSTRCTASTAGLATVLTKNQKLLNHQVTTCSDRRLSDVRWPLLVVRLVHWRRRQMPLPGFHDNSLYSSSCLY